MDQEGQRRIKRRSAAQERAVAADHGGTVTPGSGSGWRKRGDVMTPRFLFECKTTMGSKQITIHLADLQLVEQRALVSGRTPVLTFDIGSARYHILTDADFAELTDGGA